MSDKTPDPRSGLDEDGSWNPAFAGQRRPFEKGHELSLKHGAYAVIKLRPRAQEIADALRSQVPVYAPGLELALQSAGAVAARLERAFSVLEDADPDELERLEKDARGWASVLLRYLGECGLTLNSMLRAGVDLVRLAEHDPLAELRAEGARVRQERGDDV